MPISELIMSELAAAPAEFGKLLRTVPAELWDFKPTDWGGCPGETFSLREQLCHLRDLEIEGYQRRFQRTRAEESPVLESVDGYVLARERQYAEADPAAALAAYAAARRETLAMIRGFSAAELARPADFAEYGRVTLAGLVHYLSAHDRQHLASIHWLIGRMSEAAA
jgi:hypothetical protein